jgi:hypothetical protein
MYGVLKLRNKILGDPDLGWRDEYRAHGTEEDERASKPGGIPVERAGTAPSDGRLVGEAEPTPEQLASEAGLLDEAERAVSERAAVVGAQRAEHDEWEGRDA